MRHFKITNFDFLSVFFFNFCWRFTEILWGKTILFLPLRGPSLSLVISTVQYNIIIKDSLVRPNWCDVNFVTSCEDLSERHIQHV